MACRSSWHSDPLLYRQSWISRRGFRIVLFARFGIWRYGQEAGEIIFIGFSLPPTDFMADTLFRQGRLGYAKENISVIAPNATDMKPRFQQLFGPSVNFIDKTFHRWCNDISFANANQPSKRNSDGGNLKTY